MPYQRAIALFSLGLVLLVLNGCTSQAASEPEPEKSVPAAPLNAVVALGRLIPQGELIKVSVSNAQDSRVNQLLVDEGDRVSEGQVIALLQGVERREADLRDAEADVKLRQAELKKVLEGDSKISERQAKQYEIAQLQAQLETDIAQKQAAIAYAQAIANDAQLTVDRRTELQLNGAISQADLDQARRDLDTAQSTLLERQAALLQAKTTLQAQVQKAQSELDALGEVRSVDVEIAQANLEKAQIAVAQRRADLEDVRVRAPATGQILRINTRVGEQVNTAQGIVELARTQQMYAIAEVYESDIVRVKRGQRATVKTDYGGFEGELTGTVDNIGLQIGRRTLQGETDGGPNLDQNARIVEVKIRLTLSDSAKVAQFTNMLVQVSIDSPPVEGKS
jgi:HlyD family secretion protein